MHEANTIADKTIETKSVILNDYPNANFSAGNSNQPHDSNFLTLWEKTTMDCFAQFDKMVNNIWQNCTFADEIVHNHTKNYILLQQDSIDAYLQAQPINLWQWAGINISYNLKQTLLINEQTLLDSLNYVITPAAKQLRHLLEVNISNAFKMASGANIVK